MTADDRRQITVRVTPRLWMLLKRTAKAEKRSVSAQAAFLIEQGMQSPETTISVTSSQYGRMYADGTWDVQESRG